MATRHATYPGVVSDGAYVPKVVTLTLVAGAATPDPTLGDEFWLTMTAVGNTVANPSPNPANGQVLTFRVNPATFTGLAWGAKYKWGGGALAPTSSTGAAAVDLYSFRYDSVGDVLMFAGWSPAANT